MAARPGTPSFSRKIGARIRALREGANKTLESVAWACEIPKSHLSRIERGERLPSLPVLFSLAKEIGVDPIDLVGFDLRKPRNALVDALRRGNGEDARLVLRKLDLG